MSNHENQGFVELVQHMGDDLAVVNAARVSYGASSSEMTEKDERLIMRLLKDKHGTPFEQAVFTFYVRCPIFVAREWFRHRMGSFNEISGRYKELPTDFYVPKNFRMPNPDETKQMNYRYVNAPQSVHLEAVKIADDLYDAAHDAYHKLLALGIAKEHARIVLPVGIFTEFRWTVNARALMNFLNLRNAPTAQAEIRAYAAFIEKMWQREMPATHAAFIAAGRVAP